MNINGISGLNYILAARGQKSSNKGTVTNFAGEAAAGIRNSSSTTETREINSISAFGKAGRLTEKEEMMLFKQEFYAELSKIPMSSQLNTLAIRITDKGWERMKREPEYREKMISLIKRDTSGTYIGRTNEIITIGGCSAEYRASSWSADRDKIIKEMSVERRKKKKKELQKMYEMQQKKRQMERDLLMKLGEGETEFFDMPVADIMIMNPAAS